MKFSVITPAYNAEKYIENCIKAVISSDFDLSNVEHIIVDDGSKDNTKAICEKWAAKYPHIKFYSKENGNWGSVFNFVKNNKLATGDYIVICDSDDMISSNAFKLVSEKVGSDIIVGDYHYYNGIEVGKRCRTILRPLIKTINKKSPTSYMNPWFCPHCVYFKNEILYKMDDLKTGLMYQDSVLFVQLQLLAKTITYLHEPISYYWNERPGNTMTSMYTPLGTKSLFAYFECLQEKQLFELFVLYLAYCNKQTIAKLKETGVKFKFTNRKLKLQIWPIYMRLHIRLLYLKKVKQFVEK